MYLKQKLPSWRGVGHSNQTLFQSEITHAEMCSDGMSERNASHTQTHSDTLDKGLCVEQEIFNMIINIMIIIVDFRQHIRTTRCFVV